MSELDGPISIEQWRKFGLAMRKHADTGDWQALGRLNELLIQALNRAGAPASPAQQQARAELRRLHAQVLAELMQARDELTREMKRFKDQQEGLAAYQLTRMSGAVDDI
ncbi:hypothetical protein [Shewanella salipaludis]|uniref:Flagellar protein FliT n=1 Tax=Shewanella salipaludis TaxID=2723052 RepID=A0A972G3B3_9GAMM|nr:hypothetical protein [Shewanella salipaludis]NMH66721.1 hypothetical protein [Shewanella salipaludis]